jgi:nucleotide-binding universal stress UspA family protein
MARPILHPSDFSPGSAPAFRKAIVLAKGMRRPLLVVHVMPPTRHVAGDYVLTAEMYEDLSRATERAAREQPGRLLRQARAARVRATGVLLTGMAHEQILRTARGRRAEMIVMGTHGRTGLARALLGSVASRVVTDASCPVMTVRVAST